MTIFKTNKEIFSRWGTSSGLTTVSKKYEWVETRIPEIKDIDYWEEIYCEPGNIGVYGAYSPFVNLFVIIHLSLAESQCGIEQFYGLDAEMEVVNRCKDLGIVLVVRNVLVPN
jgi:hypothetical protein